MTVALKPVTSSLIQAHGYDLASRTLAIRFSNSGKVYHYRDVPPEAAEAFGKAESAGKHFGAHIRGKFDHTVVEAEAEHEGSTPD